MKPYFAVVLFCMMVVGMASPAHAIKSDIGKVVILADDILLPNETLREGETFAEQLKEGLFTICNVRMEVRVIGQDGGNAISSLALVPHILSEKPRLVIVAIGYNDALSRTDPDVIYNNLDTLLKELERAGSYVMLIGVEAPVWMEHSYTTRFNNIFPRISQRYRVIYHNGFLKGIQGDPELTQEDRYHPNRLGIAKIVQNLLPGLDSVTRQIKRYDTCTKRPTAYKCDEFMKLPPKH